MNKVILFFLIIGAHVATQAQTSSPWKRINLDNSAIYERNNEKPNSDKQLLFQLDEGAIKKALVAVQDKSVSKNSVEISIPNLNGVLEKYLVTESSNFAPELQAKYPDIRAYAGVGITDKNATLNFSMSSNGIQTMVLRSNSSSEFIELDPKNKGVYRLFDAIKREKGTLSFSCKTEDVVLNKKLLSKTSQTKSSNQQFKTLKLALSCTGEYTAFHGGATGALAAMNATMTRVNAVFNKDLAVRLVLIANNNVLIYTNAATDPYSPANQGNADVDPTWGKELQDNLTATIGSGNYDIGHLFGATGGGGNAGCIGCVCVDPTVADPLGKGSAYTSPSDDIPQGDTFDIDFVAHEMGHQLGANHSFSYAIENTGVNVEPGSGSTIMGYAGITDYDIQSSSDDYFAYVSIKQIQDNLATKSCPASVAIVNSPPTISAGSDWTIPKGTAFVLTGTGTDPNGDTISYNWEQNDTAITMRAANSTAFSTKVDGPLFRSIKPSSSPIRYMPSKANMVLNKLSSTWESVATIARILHFTLTGRDNAALGTAQTSTDEMTVTVDAAVGPFEITSQTTPNSNWIQGTSQTITWNVNGTAGLPGSSNVNIKLSLDGGLTYPTTLVANTPNDGSQIITVPTVTAMNCRILIEPTANIYYAINSSPFAIGYSVVSSCNTYTFTTPFLIPELQDYTTTINAPATTGIITDVNLSIGFTHAFMSDVQIELINPQGTVVKLFDRNCGDSNGSLLLTYDDLGDILTCGTSTTQTITPIQPLSGYNGLNPQGVWTLRVRDVASGDVGTVNSASITICTQTFTTLSAPSFEISDFALFPNPNKGIFSIQFESNSTTGVKVLVHDLLGRKVFENEYETKANFNENIQLKNAQPGVYLLTVIDGDRKEVKKIVIE